MTIMVFNSNNFYDRTKSLMIATTVSNNEKGAPDQIPLEGNDKQLVLSFRLENLLNTVTVKTVEEKACLCDCCHILNVLEANK